MAIRGNSGGGGRGAGDVRAGSAFWELYAKDGLSGVIDKLQGKVKNFGSFMRRIGGTLFGAGAALGAGPLGFLVGGVSRANEVANLSRQFQIPVELMSKLKYAADAAGASVDDVIKNPARFADLLREAPGLDAKTVGNAVDIQRQWRLTTVALQDAMLGLLEVITPVVRLTAEFVRQNAALIGPLALVAAGLVAIGAALLAGGVAMSALVSFTSALLTPMGLVTAAGIALAVVFRGELAQAFSGIGEIFGITWKGIVDSVKAGDLQLAFKILAAGVSQIFYTLLKGLVDKVRDFITGIMQFIMGNPFLKVALGPLGLQGGFLSFNYLNQTSGLLDEAAKGAGMDLNRLAGQAAAAAKAGSPLPAVFRGAEAVRGGFGATRAGQSLNYGDTARMIDLQRALVDDVKGGLADRIGAAVVQGIVMG